MATVRQSGGDYTSLNAALAAGETVIDIDQAWTIDDTSPCIQVNANVVVTVSGPARHPGYVDATFSTDHYRLVCSGAHCIDVRNSATYDGLVVKQNSTGTSNEGFRASVANSATLNLNNCIIYTAPGIAGGQEDAVNISGSVQSNRTINLTQCQIHDCARAGVAVYAQGADTTININSCNIYGCGTSGESYGGGVSDFTHLSTALVFNLQNSNVVGNQTDGDLAERGTINPVWNISNCIDSDGSIATYIDTGTNNLANRTPADNAAPGAGNWVIFENITTYPSDLRLQDSPENDSQDAHANALAHGLTIPALDITGLTARPQNTNYDIGAYEIQAGGAAPIDLTIADLEVSTELDNVTITRGRSITVQDVEVSTELDNTTLARNRAIVVQDLSVGPELENLIVSPAKLLNIAGIEVGPELDNLAITRGRSITVAGIEVGPEFDNVATNKQANLNVADLEVETELDNLVVGISAGIVLNIQGLEITPEFDNVQIARDIALVPADLEVGTELDNVLAGKETTLVIDDSETRPELDNVVVGISAGISLIIASLEISTEITGALGIARARTIAPAGIEVGPEFDNLGLGLGKTLVIQDLAVQPEMNNLSISIPGSQVFGSTNNVMLLTNETQIMSIT